MPDACADHNDHDHRSRARLRLGIPASLETLDGKVEAKLVDLSQTGAQVVVARGAAFTRGVVCWLKFEAFGFVVWREDGHFGIEFDEELPIPYLVETRLRAPDIVRNEALGDPAAARAFVEGRLSLGD